MVATNPIYEECQHGVSVLTRIVVASPSTISGHVRTALTPALYAYWERFFKLTFSEYLRSVSLEGLGLRQLCMALARLLRREVMNCEPRIRDKLISSVNAHVFADAQPYVNKLLGQFSGIAGLYSDPVTFGPSGVEWIETESNVRYEVIEANCRALGLDPEELKKLLEDAGVHLYPRLKDLVDTRNKIAHGETIGPMPAEKWDELQSFVLLLMNAVQLFLHEALEQGKYLAP